MNINNIDKAIRKSKKTKVSIATECGFTRGTLDAILRGAEVGISKIEKLASILDVPVSYFFQEEDAPVPKNIEGANAQVTERIKYLTEKNELLQSQLEDKERLIQILMKK
jgi:transcriptional regulator with XRE-family HTH domain